MQLYQIPDVIFQVDASCVDKFRYRSFLMKLIRRAGVWYWVAIATTWAQESPTI